MIKQFTAFPGIYLFLLIVLALLASACEEKKKMPLPSLKDKVIAEKVIKPEIKVTFIKEPVKNLHILSELKDKFGDTGMRQILAINRLDTRHITIGDSLCVPDTLPDDFLYFSPYPGTLTILDSIPKILIFSYPVQAFASYEYGKLVRWGPTSLGKRKTPTPEGLYFTNWKAKETVSTVNDEWILPWAFNIDNFNGISIHQFELPGYPASHSCARLLEADAEWIYYWADQWILTRDGEKIRAYGTPVIIYGKYNYRSRPPWKLLNENKDADKITEEELIDNIKQYLPIINLRKYQRDSLLVSMNADTLRQESGR